MTKGAFSTVASGACFAIVIDFFVGAATLHLDDRVPNYPPPTATVIVITATASAAA